jgi:hypothetical protein
MGLCGHSFPPGLSHSRNAQLSIAKIKLNKLVLRIENFPTKAKFLPLFKSRTLRVITFLKIKVMFSELISA